MIFDEKSSAGRFQTTDDRVRMAGRTETETGGIGEPGPGQKGGGGMPSVRCHPSSVI
jgi:hypothetical protein